MLEWTAREAPIDPSAPPNELSSYFFDAVGEGPVVTFRGFLHRDEVGGVEAVLDAAQELEAKGKVLFHHVFDSDSGLRFEIANGKTSVREGDVKMPSHVIEAIERESTARARKRGAGKPPPPKTKAKAKTTAKAKAKATAKTKSATRAHVARK